MTIGLESVTSDSSAQYSIFMCLPSKLYLIGFSEKGLMSLEVSIAFGIVGGVRA